MNINRLKSLVFAAFIFMGIPGMALAKCTDDLQGFWSADFGPTNGQYSRFWFHYTNQAQGVPDGVSIAMATATAMSPYSSDPLNEYPVNGGNIYHLTYSTIDGNVTVDGMRGNACILTFGQARVVTNPYNANTNFARGAEVAANGNSVRWCWARSSHDYGDCIQLRRVVLN